MQRPRHLGGLGALVALAALVPAASAPGRQDPPADHSFAERLSVDYVLVPVVVKGNKGPLHDLEQKAFELLVDGLEVPIESFEAGNAPATLFFLQDLSGSMELVGRLRSSRRALGYFLDRAQPGDRFAMITFAGRRVTTSVPLTDDVGRMREAAREWRPYGITALHDAVAVLPELVVDRPSSRRAVLLVSDGLDNASDVSPGLARDRIRTSEIPVYVLGLETGSPYEIDTEGRKRYRYADVMNLLAHLTGGRYYSASDTHQLDAASAAILEELRHQYILGFSTGGGGPAAAREIEVRVRRRHAEVAHRRGYHGREPLSGS